MSSQGRLGSTKVDTDNDYVSHSQPAAPTAKDSTGLMQSFSTQNQNNQQVTPGQTQYDRILAYLNQMR